jgi:N-acetylmuramate 1-kinase
VAEPSWETLRKLVGTAFPGTPSRAPSPMPGGASTRRFFRLDLGQTTAVAMFVPGAPTHEIHKDPAAAVAKRWPFLDVGDLLASRGIRVPAVYADGTADGWLVVEDLGNDTVAEYLVRSPSAKRAIYTRAVRDLARAQKALASLPEDSIIRTRAFDRDLLLWELDHFREWALEARGITLAREDRAELDQLADRLATRIASWPRGFVHRDYQSRNLMVVPKGEDIELAWVDFQDAMLGPRVYDLVALLSDSYQTFDADFVQERLDEYATEMHLLADDRHALRREFDYVTVQRKLKDAGRFVYIDQHNHNPGFLEFIEPTLGKARAALGRLTHDPDMAKLLALLDRVLPAR